MKRFFVPLALVASAVLCVNLAVAVHPVPTNPLTVKITDGSTSTIARQPSVFTDLETPWLYVPGGLATTTYSIWVDPLGHRYKVFETGQTSKTDFFLAPDWDITTKTLGNWTVFAQNGGDRGATSFSFVAAPEPISAVLYVLGAGTFGVGGYWRRRRRTKN